MGSPPTRRPRWPWSCCGRPTVGRPCWRSPVWTRCRPGNRIPGRSRSRSTGSRRPRRPKAPTAVLVDFAGPAPLVVEGEVLVVTGRRPPAGRDGRRRVRLGDPRIGIAALAYAVAVSVGVREVSRPGGPGVIVGPTDSAFASDLQAETRSPTRPLRSCRVGLRVRCSAPGHSWCGVFAYAKALSSFRARRQIRTRWPARRPHHNQLEDISPPNRESTTAFAYPRSGSSDPPGSR